VGTWVVVVNRDQLFVETSVACKVGTRGLPDADWFAVVQHLASDFDFVVSPLSFVKVLNSLARGSDQYILPNRRRLEALSPVAPLSPKFLEMPGQFVLREVLGCGRVLNTYQPEAMAEVMVSILEQKTLTAPLRALLDEVKSNHQAGTGNYTESHDEMRRAGQITPDRELWLRAKLRHLGILDLSPEEIQKLGSALDAAYQYATWIRRELRNPHYQPSRETSAWADYQQLFYLCDPTVHILYDDGDFSVRTGNSSQKSRLLKLSDVVSDAQDKSVTSA
jgi:hypothetical protein